MDSLVREFEHAKKAYDRKRDPSDVVGKLSKVALTVLGQASTSLLPTVSAGGKRYSIYRAGKSLSRPFLSELFIADPDEFESEWVQLLAACRPQTHRIELPSKDVNRIVYTAATSFCLCFDLWKPKSRKSPGTQFEILLGSLLSRLLPTHVRSKHVSLPQEAESVATDIVMADPVENRALVFPAKITTRERIVQPFAHQRILDSVFGEGRYRSVIVCVSEMQRDGERGANEVCVPGTIRLFQKHLAAVAGIYYLDPPHRYLQPDLTSVVRVGSVGELLTTDLAALTVSNLDAVRTVPRPPVARVAEAVPGYMGEQADLAPPGDEDSTAS